MVCSGSVIEGLRGGGRVDPLLDRIAERRAGLGEEAQRLRKELAEVEAELERVASAEQVVAQLLAEHDDEAGDQDGADRGQAGQARVAEPGRPALVVPHRGDGAGVDDLPADYRRLVQVVVEEGTAGQAVACKRAAAKLGLSGEPRHIEGVRVKLKRLVARGWLVESAPGRFAPRP
jgi:cell division septum initiation protein DivIVA